MWDAAFPARHNLYVFKQEINNEVLGFGICRILPKYVEILLGYVDL